MQRRISIVIILLSLLVAIRTYAQPNANFSASVTQGCVPLIVSFQDATTGNPTSWSWDLGNGVFPTVQNPSTTYLSPGVYTVKLTATSATGSDVEEKISYIVVYDTPSVSFTATPTSGCPPLQVCFTDNSTLNSTGTGTYSWFFGDGGSSSIKNPCHTYTSSGGKAVTLQVTNSRGCTKTKNIPNFINVNSKPQGSMSASQVSFCGSPATVTFTGSGTGSTSYTYYWDFGDGVLDTGQSVTHTYTGTAPICYNVRLITQGANGCLDTTINPAYICLYDPKANFTSPASACVGTAVTFTNTSTPTGSSSNWSFGSTQNSPSHVFSTPGVKTVTLISGIGGCSDTISKQITIHPSPIVNFYKIPDTPCPAPVSIQFVPTNTGLTSYDWDFGDVASSSNTSTLTSPTHVYNDNGYYKVILKAKSAQGCETIVEKDSFVKIFPLYAYALPVIDSGCVPRTVNFQGRGLTDTTDLTSFYPWGVKTYTWNFGDGSSNSNQQSPTHVYTDTGIFYAVLTVTTNNGCVETDTIEIRVGIKPTADFSATPLVICADKPQVTFTNTSVNAKYYYWDFGEDASKNTYSNGGNATYTYEYPGFKTVVLKAWNNGCLDTAMRTNYIEVLPSKAIINIDYNCDSPRYVQFIDTNSIGDQYHKWIFGDGTTDTSTNPLHIYSSLGVYNVMLITYNDSTGCDDTATTTLNLNSPTLTFTASDTAICPTDVVNFTASFQGGTVKDASWYIDNGIVGTPGSMSLSHQFDFVGYHDVKFVVIDINLCTWTVDKQDHILVSKPEANFSASPRSGCLPLTVQFYDTSHTLPGVTIATRDWDFGNGATTSTTNSTVLSTYTNKGLYGIGLVVTDNVGCKDTAYYNDYINASKPKADFNVANIVCLGDSIEFFNNSIDADSFKWYFGDGDSSTLAQPKHPYYQRGFYTVTLIAYDTLGCSDTMVFSPQLEVKKPVAAFTVSDSVAICPPLAVKFTNTSTGNTSGNNWSFGNGATSTVISPTEVYNTPGNYIARLVVTDNFGCKDTATKNMKLLGYSGAFSYSPLTGCKPLTVNFTTTLSTIPSLLYDFGDGVTQANSLNATHTYTNPGAYVPKLIMSDGLGCSSFSLGKDTIKVDGVYPGFDFSPACQFSTVTFNDSSKGVFSYVSSRKWTFHDGQTSTSKNPSKFFGLPGKYPITLVVTNANGCIDSITKEFEVFEPMQISVSDDTTICLLDSALLVPTGAVSYTWSPAASLSCVNCITPYAKPQVKTEYTVISTDGNGCHDTDKVVIDIKTHVESIAGGGNEICEGDTLNLYASGARTYKWFPPTGLDNPESSNPVASPNETVEYIVVAYEASCIPDTNKVKVVIHPLPDVNAKGERTVPAGTATDLFASGKGYTRIEWVPDYAISCKTCSSPSVSPFKTTTYKVLAYSDFGCVDSAEVTITVLCDNSQVFIPNTFTPNGDGQNDIFYPRGEGINRVKSFRIYNRWGEVVFERNDFTLNDKTKGWDGTYNGNTLEPAVYIYTVEAYCETGELIKWKGDVSILR